MSKSKRCSVCERYEAAGHNFCLMCGFPLMEGFVPYARIAVGYTTTEKYCGYCGKGRNVCEC